MEARWASNEHTSRHETIADFLPMTDDDVEQRLARLTPCGVRAELRGDVLAAVASQLQPAAPSRWLRLAALATAASVLLGIVLNVWVNRAADRHLARLFGPPPVSKQAMEIAKAVEEITDAQTGQWVYRQLTVPRKSADFPAKYYAMVEQLIRELQIVSKGFHYAAPEEDTEMDRDRPGLPGGGRTGCQRLAGMDYRYTA
jgi:hypothetical protein